MENREIEIDNEMLEFLISQLDALKTYFQKTESEWDDIIAIPAIEFLKSRIRKRMSESEGEK